MSTDKARIAELNVLLDKAERESTRLLAAAASVVSNSYAGGTGGILRCRECGGTTFIADWHKGNRTHRRPECPIAVLETAVTSQFDATAIRQPTPDVQTALADALEGLRYKGIDHEAPHAPARFCDHAAEPCDRCEAARKALALVGRKP